MINEKIFKVEDAEPNSLDYQEAYKYFITDYARENPIYKKKAKNDYVMEMNRKMIRKSTSA